MKRFKYFVLTGIIITCIAGCQNNNTVTVPVEDYIVEDSDDLGTASIGVADDNQQDTTADELFDVETIRKILQRPHISQSAMHGYLFFMNALRSSSEDDSISGAFIMASPHTIFLP